MSKPVDNLMPVPDFMLIGAGKSGTTALHYYLQQHPQIFVPSHKDPSYFAMMDELPAESEDDPDEMNHHPSAIYDAEQYQNLFTEAGSGQLTGDVSTMYLYHPKAAENIRIYRPGAKFIAILRHPADRLYSRYMHLARDGRHHITPLNQIFDRNSIWWRRNDLINEGFFYKHLKRYFDQFDSSQILVLLFDDLKRNENDLIRQIWSFLDVDEHFVPETEVRLNQSGIVKHAWKDYLIGHPSILRRSLEAIAPGIVQRMRDHPKLKRVVSELRSKNLDRPDFDPELRRKITDEIYQDDILKLQSLIGLDLSHWLNV